MEPKKLDEKSQRREESSEVETSAHRRKQKEDLAKIRAAFQRDKEQLRAAEGAVMEFKVTDKNRNAD